MLNLGLIDGCLVMMKTPILSWTELVGSLQSIEEAEISRDSIFKTSSLIIYDNVGGYIYIDI